MKIIGLKKKLKRLEDDPVKNYARELFKLGHTELSIRDNLKQINESFDTPLNNKLLNYMRDFEKGICK